MISTRIHRAALVVVAISICSSPAFAASNSNKGANPNGKPFVEIAGTIIEVEGELSSLQDQIDSLVGRVDSIEDAQAAMVSVIANLRAENVTLQAQIDANAGDINSIEDQISALNSTIMLLEQQIATLGDADGALQAQIDANEASVTTLALAVDTLQGNLQASIDNNAALIAAMQQQIDRIQESLDLYQLLVSGNCPAGQSIREIQPSGGVVCEVDDVGGGAGTISQYRVYANREIPANGSGNAFAVCPIGFALTGGGFYGTVGTSQNFGGYPTLFNSSDAGGGSTSTRTFMSYVYGAQYSGYLYAMAICIRHN